MSAAVLSIGFLPSPFVPMPNRDKTSAGLAMRRALASSGSPALPALPYIAVHSPSPARPRRGPGIPSLEPCDPPAAADILLPSSSLPEIKPHELPSAMFARVYPPPLMDADPTDPLYDSPSLRLQELFALIEEVLTAQNSNAHTIPAHVEQLNVFYRRAISLYPVVVNEEAAMHANTTVSADVEQRFGQAIAGMKQLERDWWESEAAAAWYGPGPVAQRLMELDGGDDMSEQESDDDEATEAGDVAGDEVAERSGPRTLMTEWDGAKWL